MPAIHAFLGYYPADPEPPTLGSRLVEYRKRHGLTQKQLAADLDLDPTTLSGIEQDQRKRLNHRTKGKLLALFGKL
jgi:transcriptional regulator with XRE-family HTH domain